MPPHNANIGAKALQVHHSIRRHLSCAQVLPGHLHICEGLLLHTHRALSTFALATTTLGKYGLWKGSGSSTSYWYRIQDSQLSLKA